MAKPEIEGVDAYSVKLMKDVAASTSNIDHGQNHIFYCWSGVHGHVRPYCVQVDAERLDLDRRLGEEMQMSVVT